MKDLHETLALARAAYDQHDYAKAAPLLRRVVAQHDEFADVHTMLGLMAYEGGRMQEAQEHFERALELNPRYTEAAVYLSICYNELGRYEEARRVHAEALEPEGAGPATLNQIARARIANLHLTLGDAYNAIGDAVHAYAQYSAALSSGLDYPDIRLKQAQAALNLGRRDESRELLEGLVRDAPEFHPARLQLGVLLWSGGETQEARREWRYVLSRRPDDRMARFYMSLESRAH